MSSRRAIFFCRSFVRSSVNEFVTYAHLLCATLAFEYASNQRYQFIGIKWMFYRNRLMRHKQFKSHILVDFFPRFWTDIWCVYLMIECQLRIWLLVIKCKWFGSFFWKVRDFRSQIRDSLWKVNTWTFQYMLFFNALCNFYAISIDCFWMYTAMLGDFVLLINIHGSLCSVLLVPPLRFAVRLVYEYTDR